MTVPLRHRLRPADYDETQHMASLSPEENGIDNTIFVSPKGYARHAARIKIAIDPPRTFKTTAKTASMAIHDYTVIGDVPTRVRRQAQLWIAMNRDALL